MNKIALLGALVLGASIVPAAYAAPSASAARVGGQLVKNERYAISSDVQGDCKANAECKVVLKIEALGDFHVNKDYPTYKFKANDVDGVAFTGTDAGGKNVFSKAAGDFRMDGEKVGYLTLHFKPSKAGAINIAGQFKFCVCNAQNCQPESADLTVPVTVK